MVGMQWAKNVATQQHQYSIAVSDSLAVILLKQQGLVHETDLLLLLLLAAVQLPVGIPA